MSRKAIFVAATGQNVGKTTVCLGMIASLKKRFPQLGFMKPVGQQHVKVAENLLVDKDVVLFKEHFNIPSHYGDMSPVIFPKGFTRDYLDGKVDRNRLLEKIVRSFARVSSEHHFVIVEGTGHVGVGSIIQLNNAAVAAALGLDLVIIAKGGLGSAFDELALNKEMCERYGVKICGVILNKVVEKKREMVENYMKKALLRWNIPLLGTIPFNEFLSTPAIRDFESLFNTRLLSGEQYHYLHFQSIRLVATSVEVFREKMFPNQLIVTPATREDIIYALIEQNGLHSQEPQHGLILTGRYPPLPSLIQRLQESAIPSLYAPSSSYEAMKMITSFTAKIRKEDHSKVKKAIDLVEGNLNLSVI